MVYQSFRRYVCFQPLEGWGGFCSWLATGGAAGSHSIPVWLSFIGVIAMLNGVFNLLPLGGLNGGHLIWLLIEKTSDPAKAERWIIRYTLISVIFLFAVYLRVLCADVIWFFR
jgi:regulator of sigma E protease